tara:strand:- start:318 stop:551 length:234 start_codon:yes stop_codon:yes gene_type:complete
MNTSTHKIIGKAHIEGTQRGFVVWVKTNKRTKAQLTDANENFAFAQITANDINNGHWIGTRKGGTFHVTGNTLTVTV